jgi:sortase A
MIFSATAPASATETVNGPDGGLFGKPTSVEAVPVTGGYHAETDNINRSKDSALIPPPFGSPVSNTDGYSISGNFEYVASNDAYANVPPLSDDGFAYYGAGYSNKFTLPDGLYYADGSIGALSIPKLGVSAKVYEEESLENLKKGIGHFKNTSCWDGNVGFAAHNRGAADYFGQIHTLKNGDRIVYETKLGTRTYEVYFVGTVDETDLSRLGRTEENIVSLFTCVRNESALRVCVQAISLES